MWPTPVVSASTLVLVLDLCGAFVFALSGAMAGIKHKLDLFGVMVLSFAAATLGGIMRDVVIGAVPPPGISDWRYVAVSIAAGLATIYCHPLVDRIRSSVLVFDAAGLALFAVSGAQKAVDFPARTRHGDAARHVDRDRWGDGARRAGRRGAVGPARRHLRGRRSRRSGVVVLGRVLNSLDSVRHRRRGALLRSPPRRDPPRVAAPWRAEARIAGGVSEP